jgi:hypothetical protein
MVKDATQVQTGLPFVPPASDGIGVDQVHQVQDRPVVTQVDTDRREDGPPRLEQGQTSSAQSTGESSLLAARTGKLSTLGVNAPWLRDGFPQNFGALSPESMTRRMRVPQPMIVAGTSAALTSITDQMTRETLAELLGKKQPKLEEVLVKIDVRAFAALHGKSLSEDDATRLEATLREEILRALDQMKGLIEALGTGEGSAKERLQALLVNVAKSEVKGS